MSKRIEQNVIMFDVRTIVYCPTVAYSSLRILITKIR